MPKVIKVSGIERHSKNFICVVKNLKDEYQLGYNIYFKTIGAQLFGIDDDYDFGSIDPHDLIVEMFDDASLKYPGIYRT